MHLMHTYSKFQHQLHDMHELWRDLTEERFLLDGFIEMTDDLFQIRNEQVCG